MSNDDTARRVINDACSGKGCLGKADDYEPVFVLVADDVTAPIRVREWANDVELLLGRPTDKTRRARRVALEMEQWQRDYPERVKIPD